MLTKREAMDEIMQGLRDWVAASEELQDVEAQIQRLDSDRRRCETRRANAALTVARRGIPLELMESYFEVRGQLLCVTFGDGECDITRCELLERDTGCALKAEGVDARNSES